MIPVEVLYAIIWIAYGAFAAYQTEADYDSKVVLYIFYILAAPVVFILKALYGAFKRYD